MTGEKICAVIGYGSWATSLVRQLNLKNITVKWLVTNPEVSAGLLADGHNPKYVRDAEIDLSHVSISDCIDEVVKEADFVLLCCPSAYLKQTLSKLSVSLEEKFIISAIKGIVPDECVTVLEYIHEHYGLPFKQLGLISGPSHAEEVSNGRISYITAAAASLETAGEIAELFNGGNLKIDTSTDIYGLEYAGVLKNIYAIVAGMADGLGYGDNFLAVLVSRAAEEMRTFMDLSYPYERDITGRAYLGDLLVTCYSNFSRNRRLGNLIGRGCSVKSALNEMTMVAEGYYSADLIMKVCISKNIHLPIATMAYNVLYRNTGVRRSLAELSSIL